MNLLEEVVKPLNPIEEPQGRHRDTSWCQNIEVMRLLATVTQNLSSKKSRKELVSFLQAALHLLLSPFPFLHYIWLGPNTHIHIPSLKPRAIIPGASQCDCCSTCALPRAQQKGITLGPFDLGREYSFKCLQAGVQHSCHLQMC